MNEEMSGFPLSGSNSQDCEIICRKVISSPFAIIAPHGGGIEPGTSELAESIAHKGYHLYCFLGKRYANNQDLHVKSTFFDEPEALELLAEVEVCLALHGCEGDEELIYIGGLNNKLILLTTCMLLQHGFQVKDAPKALAAKSPKNICNRCLGKKGLQLELSYGLRKSMFENVDRRQGREKVTQVFYRFVEAVDKALRGYRQIFFN
ncbi:poly-gamma-glutamate hydrolase family protein [Candidatus Contubernalis alkaliaceticus]|uniref:poly-gamma-glutamate hydrolase family protein n=1 Tax=Candidatus Contubernalis alkaliaceticus TaxID=338645 RepID=UPI001F4C269C|nr:poly-gamma-glutamate hydrolase family protein [Candidatus Contubernalis alkalaceticus]UNC91936.1 poly-gamma-glutamate hydrolase family protein [Candidatus Contubernalis alkalaceticus]